MRKITIEIEDGLEWIDTRTIDKWFFYRDFDFPESQGGRIKLIVEHDVDTVRIKKERYWSDVAIMGKQYKKIEEEAKKRGISAQKMIEKIMEMENK